MSIEEIAARHGFSGDAGRAAYAALQAGGFSQAQFSHPELGGMGQWMSGGMMMIGDMFNDNLKWRVDCEFGATSGKFDLALCAKKNGLDAIHDTVHEMARDEARHGRALKGLLERYFK